MTKATGDVPEVGGQMHLETNSDLQNSASESSFKSKQMKRFIAENGNASSSAPTSRTSSFKNHPRPKLLDVEIDVTRRRSLPSPTSSSNLLSVSFDNTESVLVNEENGKPLRRVRSFKTTSKGIINRGDSFKKSTNSISSTGSAYIPDTISVEQRCSKSRSRINSAESKDSGTAVSTSSSCPAQYRIVIIGAPGVGKTSLANQFMTSEYVAFENETDEKDDNPGVRSITVLLDSEESTLGFIEMSLETKDLDGQQYDAFGIVFSINDQASFRSAVEILDCLRHDIGTDRPIILIGNKVDLVRKRKVTKEDGRAAAIKYESKYTETSAALNHHVDELLVGMLTQIRLKLTPRVPAPNPIPDVAAAQKSKRKRSGPRKLIDKLLRRSPSRNIVHACENLLVL
ncbi:hypothetical protein ACJMK2_010344 [Sinanodonta woodiana]|uniref:Uncharacterized protein n=1 Tax=Sinanodonta woodiana TaxID=1069815 RepID=A0ABD3VGB2_SINWO